MRDHITLSLLEAALKKKLLKALMGQQVRPFKVVYEDVRVCVCVYLGLCACVSNTHVRDGY